MKSFVIRFCLCNMYFVLTSAQTSQIYPSRIINTQHLFHKHFYKLKISNILVLQQNMRLNNDIKQNMTWLFDGTIQKYTAAIFFKIFPEHIHICYN